VGPVFESLQACVQEIQGSTPLEGGLKSGAHAYRVEALEPLGCHRVAAKARHKIPDVLVFRDMVQ
jgi:hypothetical protein